MLEQLSNIMDYPVKLGVGRHLLFVDLGDLCGQPSRGL